MKNSNIEWCDHTFNPWIGCTKVSPACDHCYAERSTPARVVRRAAGIETWGPRGQRVRTSADNWRQPLRWNAEAKRTGTRARVFCASLADVFDNAVPLSWRYDLAMLILDTPHLDWLLLTKRIGNAGEMMDWMFVNGPPGNVWLGATITSQAEADRDIPRLLAVPAARRFLSMEPLLGPVDLTELQPAGMTRAWVDALAGRVASLGGSGPAYTAPRLDWVIVGGESGPGARPMHPDWVRSLRDQCQEAGVPFFFKQWGEFMPPESRGAQYPAKDWRDVVDATGTTRRVAFSGDRVLESSRQVVRVGKKAAGRLLDGREWNGVPA